MRPDPPSPKYPSPLSLLALAKALPQESIALTSLLARHRQRLALRTLPDQALVKGAELLRLLAALDQQLGVYARDHRRMVQAGWDGARPDVMSKLASNWADTWDLYADLHQRLVGLALDLRPAVDPIPFAAERNRASACRDVLRGWLDSGDSDPRRFPVNGTTSHVAAQVETSKLRRVLLERIKRHEAKRPDQGPDAAADDVKVWMPHGEAVAKVKLANRTAKKESAVMKKIRDVFGDPATVLRVINGGNVYHYHREDFEVVIQILREESHQKGDWSKAVARCKRLPRQEIQSRAEAVRRGRRNQAGNGPGKGC